MVSKTGRFRRADRILRSQDFQRVVKSGKRLVFGGFVVVVTPRADVEAGRFEEPSRRLGVTVSKRVGSAVIRNRVKRCIREWFRHSREGLPQRSDIVVIARRSARDLTGTEIWALLNRAIPGAGVRKSRPATAESQ